MLLANAEDVRHDVTVGHTWQRAHFVDCACGFSIEGLANPVAPLEWGQRHIDGEGA